MVRSEFILAGCVFVLLGVALLFVGYDKIQETPVENVVTFIEQVSGQKAPSQLHPPKTMGYVLLSFGGMALVAGVGFILSSRVSEKQ